MRKNVLYIGNALSNQGNTVSNIETFSKLLEEFCNVTVSSDKKNKIWRLLDMVATVFHYRKKADFVLIDTYSTTNFYFALVVSQLCRFFRIPYISILHGGNLENRLKNHPIKSSYLFKNAKFLVAPSNYLKNVFERYGYSDVYHLPNPIEIDKYTYRERTIDSIDILWVRSFSEIYNPLLAIAVHEELVNRGYHSELIMVGPDKDGTMLKCKEVSERKKMKILFTGLLSKEDWIHLSNQSNVFLNTTNVDNTPMSVIESMALGIPVVSTNVGGLEYLIEHNIEGLLVPPNNVSAMTDAILQLRSNDAHRENITRKARQKVSEFDWKIIKPKWQDLLTST